MMHFKIVSKSRKIAGQFYLIENQEFVLIKILSLLTNPIFWLFYKGHRNSTIPDLLNIFLKFSFPQIQDRIRDVVEVCFISGRLLPLRTASSVVKVLLASGCSWSTRAQGGPSHVTAPIGAPASTRRTHLGHRRGSGAWTVWQ